MDTRISFRRTHGNDPEFRALVKELDFHLNKVFGADQVYFDQFNFVNESETVLVASINGEPAGCGCIRSIDDETTEIKRMFVREHYRKFGLGAAILKELEMWAVELNHHFAVLETGKDLKNAVSLYQKNGYQVIPNYGPYHCVDSSVCMKKNLKGL